MRRILTTALALSIALPFAFSGGVPAGAASKVTKIADAKNDVQQYDFDLEQYMPSNHPIDIKTVRVWYSKDSQLRADIKFNKLKRTSWSWVTVSVNPTGDDGDGLRVRAYRSGETEAINDGDQSVECDVTFRAKPRAKLISVRVPASCFGAPDRLEVFQVFSIGNDEGSIFDSIDYVAINSR